MNSQDFLKLIIAVSGAFVFWYLISRGGGRKPTILNLRAQDTAPLLKNPPPASQGAGELNSFSKSHPDLKESTCKNLNVFFNYNGHTWDAYEVLGVPAGSSLPAVTRAFQEAILSTDPSAIGFLETAYKSILDRK